jgi:uncharacterized protein (TIGR00251 family)
VKIRVKVIPSSKTGEVVREDDVFLVRVKEPAKEGKANRAVIKLLATYFKVPQKQIVISSGFKSKDKVVRVEGLGK